MEAEIKAARERAIVPLEARMKQFKDMLLERGVREISVCVKGREGRGGSGRDFSSWGIQNLQCFVRATISSFLCTMDVFGTSFQRVLWL